MSNINFNIEDNRYPYDCLYFDTNYGYRACLNGKRLELDAINKKYINLMMIRQRSIYKNMQMILQEIMLNLMAYLMKNERKQKIAELSS